MTRYDEYGDDNAFSDGTEVNIHGRLPGNVNASVIHWEQPLLAKRRTKLMCWAQHVRCPRLSLILLVVLLLLEALLQYCAYHRSRRRRRRRRCSVRARLLLTFTCFLCPFTPHLLRLQGEAVQFPLPPCGGRQLDAHRHELNHTAVNANLATVASDLNLR